MNFVLIALVILAVAILLPPLLAEVTQSEGKKRSAWQLVMSTPALLVPALIVGLVFFGLPFQVPLVPVENPFLVRWRPGIDAAWSFAYAGTVAVCIAGFLGLLDAVRQQQKPDGRYFWQGIKDHVLTVMIAKLALFGALIAIHRAPIADDRFKALLMVAPSMLLAPVLGTAAQHPKRPFLALRAALRRSRWDLHHTAKLLVSQILVLFGLWCLFLGDAKSGFRSIHILAEQATVLSFNPFPFFQGRSALGPEVGWGVRVLSLVVSSVFMVLHYQRVQAKPQSGRDARAATAST